ncbi:MAG: periplasmic protein TonB [Verrucomicrobiota bacterium]|jgi:TonB family protein
MIRLPNENYAYPTRVLHLRRHIFIRGRAGTIRRHISSEEIRARLIETPKPDYPELARRLHHTGTGIYGLYFDARGQVSGIRIFKSTGHPELDIAALKGLVRWRAKPGPSSKVKLPVTVTLTERMETYVIPTTSITISEDERVSL